MTDLDLSHQLHSLAATVVEPLDLGALHRRITFDHRRRAVAKVGVAGAGVAALVGGLVVVRDQRTGTPTSGAAVTPSGPVDSTAPAPATLPDCDAALADLRATLPPGAQDVGPSSDGSASPTADDIELGFKGFATILAIDGSTLTFAGDDSGDDSGDGTGDGTSASFTAVLDSTSLWVDNGTTLDVAPTLQVGQHVVIATTAVAGAADHVVFVDVGTPPLVDVTAPDDPKIGEPGIGGYSTPDDESLVVRDSALDSLPADLPTDRPTDKALGTITAVDAAAFTVTLDDDSTTVVGDLASSTFYVGETVCAPAALVVGTAVGVASHIDASGNPVADSVSFLP